METNKFIEDYLDYYCKLENPEYAILVKGPWGAGKTWFIKKYIEKLKLKEQKVLYVSLYGTTSFSEIEEALFQQLHPVLSSKAMSIAGKVLKGVLKTTLKIDLNHDSKEDGSISSQIPEIEIPEYLTNTENCILVFDDLERCGMKLENVMGYINHFVEHQGLRIVIVANEEEIESNNDEASSKSYARTKEKLIGKTLEIKADFDDVVSNFIDTISNKQAKRFLRDSKEVIREIYELSGYENLRHLKQALWDFERLFIALPTIARSNSELVLRLLRFLLAFSFEIRRGELKPADIKKINKTYWSKFATDQQEETPENKFIEKYKVLNFPDLLLSDKCWADFIGKGVIEEKTVQESINSSVYYQDKNTPEWKIFWHFRELTNEEYKEILKEVTEKYNKRKFEELSVIKHLIGLFLQMSEIGLIKKTKSSIIADAKKYIQYLKSNGLLPKEETTAYHNDSYDGLQFFGVGISEFKDMLDYINEEIAKTNIEKMPEAGKDLLKVMKEDTDKYSRMVRFSNSEDQIYCRIPIFSHIKPKDFVATLMGLKPPERRLIISTFNERYKFSEPELIEEVEWLRRVNILLNSKAKKIKGVEAHMITSFFIPNIEKNIEKLEKIKPEEDKKDINQSIELS